MDVDFKTQEHIKLKIMFSMHVDMKDLRAIRNACFKRQLFRVMLWLLTRLFGSYLPSPSVSQPSPSVTQPSPSVTQPSPSVTQPARCDARHTLRRMRTNPTPTSTTDLSGYGGGLNVIHPGRPDDPGLSVLIRTGLTSTEVHPPNVLSLRKVSSRPQGGL